MMEISEKHLVIKAEEIIVSDVPATQILYEGLQCETIQDSQTRSSILEQIQLSTYTMPESYYFERKKKKQNKLTFNTW